VHRATTVGQHRSASPLTTVSTFRNASVRHMEAECHHDDLHALLRKTSAIA